MDKDILRQLIESVEHAEDEIHRVLRVSEETHGLKALSKRADTIMGKLEELKWSLVDKQR